MDYDSLIDKITNNNSDLIKKLNPNIISDKEQFRGGMRFQGDGKNFSQTEIEIKKLESELALNCNIGNLNSEEIVETTITDVNKDFHTGYLDYVLEAWKNHNGIVIGPWHIWNIILYNLKELNQQQPELTKHLYTTGTTNITNKTNINVYSDKFNINEVISELKKHIPADTFDTLLPNFPSAPVNYNESMYGLLCEISYDYYEVMILCCGIPTVKIEGSLEEWTTLLQHVNQVQKLHTNLNIKIDQYLEQVVSITNDFVTNYSNQTYWLNFFEVQKCGSGSQAEITGHIAKLFPTTILVGKLPKMMSNYVYKISDENGNINLGKYMSGIISSHIDSNGISVPQYEIVTTILASSATSNNNSITNDFVQALKFINSCHRTPVGHHEISESEYARMITEHPQTTGLISAEDVTKSLLKKTSTYTIGTDGEMIPEYPNPTDEQYIKQLQHIKSIQEKNKGKSVSELLLNATADTINRTKIFESFWFGHDSFVSSELTSEKLGCYNFVGLTTFRYLQYLPKQAEYLQKVKDNIGQILEFYKKHSTTVPYYIPIVSTFNPEIILAMINEMEQSNKIKIDQMIDILCSDNTNLGIEDLNNEPNDYQNEETNNLVMIWKQIVVYLLFHNRMDHSIFKIRTNETIERTEHVGYVCLTDLISKMPQNIKQSCLKYLSDIIEDQICNRPHSIKELRLSELIVDFYKSIPDGFGVKFIGEIRHYLQKYFDLNKLFGNLDLSDPLTRSIIKMGYENDFRFDSSFVTFSNGMKLDYSVINTISTRGVQNNSGRKNELHLSWGDEDFSACAYFLISYDTFDKTKYSGSGKFVLCNYDDTSDQNNTNFPDSSLLHNMMEHIDDYVFLIKLMEVAHEKLNVASYSKKLRKIINESYYSVNGKDEFILKQKIKIDQWFNTFDLMSETLKQKLLTSCKTMLKDMGANQYNKNNKLIEYAQSKITPGLVENIKNLFV